MIIFLFFTDNWRKMSKKIYIGNCCNNTYSCNRKTERFFLKLIYHLESKQIISSQKPGRNSGRNIKLNQSGLSCEIKNEDFVSGWHWYWLFSNMHITEYNFSHHLENHPKFKLKHKSWHKMIHYNSKKKYILRTYYLSQIIWN